MKYKILLTSLFILGISTTLNASLTLSKNSNYTQRVSKETLEIIKGFKKACDAGDSKECFDLGFIYNAGKGVEKDYVKAIKYYTIACDTAYARACTRLGLLYGEGKGVKKDMSKATKLFKKGCEGGHEDGCMLYQTFKSLI